jgi:nicotinamidase-related amidase
MISASEDFRAMTQQQNFVIDPGRTVVLIMDFQNGIVGNAARNPQQTLDNAASVLAAARTIDVPVIHVVHRGGRFEAETSESGIHSDVAPRADERVFEKRRAGAFSTTGLDVLLREAGRDTLVIMGVATSGCVLSTVRWAADINYRVVVVKDACDDPDEEVHRVLTEKLFPRQAMVLTTEQFVNGAYNLLG